MGINFDWSLKSVLVLVLCCGTTAVLFSLGFFQNQKSVSSVASPEVQELIASKIRENAVMVFSKSYCPYCTRAKEALTKRNINYGVIELDTLPNGAAIQSGLLHLTKQKTVPNIFINQEHLGGCDSLMSVIKNEKLQSMLDASASTK